MSRPFESVPAVVWRWLAVVVVVLAHLAAHAPAATPQHDDLVTLHLAAGSQDAWQELVAEPRWRTVGDYHDLLERGAPAPPERVLEQVARADIHPPLHEVLISAWLPVAGRSLFNLLLVNVALAGAMAWVVARLARRCGAAEPLSAAIAVGVSACPAMLMTGQQLRPYQLGALLALLLADWVIEVVSDGAGPRLAGRSWALGAGVVAALALTSFAGVFVAAGAAVAVVTVTPSRSRAWRAATVFPAGAGLALLLWPAALDQVGRQTTQASRPFTEVAARGGRVLETVASILWPSAPLPVATVVVAAVALAAVVSLRHRGRPVAAVALMTGVGLVGHLVFYFAGRTPIWAMAPKYLAFVLPLLLLVALLAGRDIAGAVGVLMLVVAAGVVGHPAVVDVLEPPPPPVAETVDAVLVTNPRRGVGLRPLWHVPPDAAAVVGLRDELDDLVKHTPGCRALVVHNSQGGDSDVSRKAFNDLFRTHDWQLEPVEPPTRRSRAQLAVRRSATCS